MSGTAYSGRCIAEAIGTTLLLATVVGSGIMGERLAGGNVALALLANSVATGAGLTALILAFAPVSGAHFNPMVTVGAAALGRFPPEEVWGYIAAQVLGAVLGVALAHAMFDAPLWMPSTHPRPGASLVLSEAVATFGLLLVILEVARDRPAHVPYAVGAYILAAYWFTASTSFANPAVTIARGLTDTFTGIRFADVPGFVGGQLLGGAAAIALSRWWSGRKRPA